jgi:hypothetical protein
MGLGPRLFLECGGSTPLWARPLARRGPEASFRSRKREQAPAPQGPSQNARRALACGPLRQLFTCPPVGKSPSIVAAACLPQAGFTPPFYAAMGRRGGEVNSPLQRPRPKAAGLQNRSVLRWLAGTDRKAGTARVAQWLNPNKSWTHRKNTTRGFSGLFSREYHKTDG